MAAAAPSGDVLRVPLSPRAGRPHSADSRQGLRQRLDECLAADRSMHREGLRELRRYRSPEARAGGTGVIQRHQKGPGKQSERTQRARQQATATKRSLDELAARVAKQQLELENSQKALEEATVASREAAEDAKAEEERQSRADEDKRRALQEAERAAALAGAAAIAATPGATPPGGAPEGAGGASPRG